MNKESDNTKEEVELSQLVGAIIRDVAKARVQADQYSHLLSEKYKEKADTGEQLVSFPVPRAEISDVEVKFKFAVSEIKEAPDSTETKNFFFNKILEKYTPILTEKYFSLCNENKIKISPQKEQSYQINIRDSIAQWIQDTFICEISEDKKNLQIQKSEKINDLADALKKISIPLSNIFEEIKNKTHPIANDIINLYKKNPESFKKHLEIEKPELLAANDTDAGEVNLKFKDSKIKEYIILKKDKSKWEEIRNISWKKQTTNTTNNLLSIAFSNGLWVAFGREGTIITWVSIDGISWVAVGIKRNSGVSNHLYGVTYGNDMWVAVGYKGTILTSKDGISWIKQNSGVSQGLCGVAYANSMWVAVGQYGTILTSSDGISWIKRNSGVSNHFYGVTYGNGMWVAVNWNKTIVTSSDGISWIKQNSVSQGLCGVAYANSMWTVVGNSGAIFTSSNGISWKKQSSGTTSGWFWRISYYSGTWFASGSVGIFASNDAINWIQQYNGGEIRKVACSNGIAVAVGSRGTILTSNISNIKNFINELHKLEQQSIDGGKEENFNTIQEVIKNDEVIKSTIGEISNEKMKLRKDDQLIVEVNSEELEKMEEEKISEISFKTNIKNYKWLKEEENTFNLIPEE